MTWYLKEDRLYHECSKNPKQILKDKTELKISVCFSLIFSFSFVSFIHNFKIAVDNYVNHIDHGQLSKFHCRVNQFTLRHTFL